MAVTWKNIQYANTAGLVDSIRANNAQAAEARQSITDSLQGGIDDHSTRQTAAFNAAIQTAQSPDEVSQLMANRDNSWLNMADVNTAVASKTKEFSDISLADSTLRFRNAQIDKIEFDKQNLQDVTDILGGGTGTPAVPSNLSDAFNNAVPTETPIDATLFSAENFDFAKKQDIMLKLKGFKHGSIMEDKYTQARDNHYTPLINSKLAEISKMPSGVERDKALALGIKNIQEAGLTPQATDTYTSLFEDGLTNITTKETKALERSQKSFTTQAVNSAVQGKLSTVQDWKNTIENLVTEGGAVNTVAAVELIKTPLISFLSNEIMQKYRKDGEKAEVFAQRIISDPILKDSISEYAFKLGLPTGTGKATELLVKSINDRLGVSTRQARNKEGLTNANNKWEKYLTDKKATYIENSDAGFTEKLMIPGGRGDATGARNDVREMVNDLITDSELTNYTYTDENGDTQTMDIGPNSDLIYKAIKKFKYGVDDDYWIDAASDFSMGSRHRINDLMNEDPEGMDEALIRKLKDPKSLLTVNQLLNDEAWSSTDKSENLLAIKFVLKRLMEDRNKKEQKLRTEVLKWKGYAPKPSILD